VRGKKGKKKEGTRRRKAAAEVGQVSNQKKSATDNSKKMAVRSQFENSSEVGVFARLTNTYCLVAYGGSDNFRVFEAELQDHIPVVRASIAGCRIVGRLTVGTPAPPHVMGHSTTREVMLMEANLCEILAFF
jgi:translation initiation factor 6